MQDQVVISSIDWLRVWFKFDCVEHSLDGELLLIIVGSLCISTIIIVIVVIIFTIFTILIIFIIVIMFIIVTLFTCHNCHHHNLYNFLDQGCGKLLRSYFICEWMKWIESLLTSSPNICSLKTNFSSLTRTWPSCKMLHNVLFLMQVGTNLTSRMSWRKQIDRLVISRTCITLAATSLYEKELLAWMLFWILFLRGLVQYPGSILFWILLFCILMEYCFENSSFVGE